MKEKRHKHDKSKKHKRRSKSPSSRSSESDEWVEKSSKQDGLQAHKERDDWMAMTGMIKTYSKEDIKTKREDKNKKHIDSYNPATCSRELNPYWKNGGSGLPQSKESFRKSRPFMKPSDDDDEYYSRTAQHTQNKDTYKIDRKDRDRFNERKVEMYSKHEKSYNWKKQSGDRIKPSNTNQILNEQNYTAGPSTSASSILEKKTDSNYLSDEKMNKLAAKIVKAEIMGDTKVVIELKNKLEAAREYRKQNPNAGKDADDEGVMLISTSSSGNSRPLTHSGKGDPRSKGGKRKSETYAAGERTKYFGNDDKYNLAQMFQQEKYGSNYSDEAELAKIAGKSKNPNDDLEDIFMDEISKNRNEAKDSEIEKQRAISQHVKMEKSLEGCEYCLNSKNMLKHLMITCGQKVYLAVPARKSLVKDQCIITTIQHNTCVTSLDEDVWEEVMNFRKALMQFFNSQNKDVVFFETAMKLHKYPHMLINCVPLPRDSDSATIYFKKALLECEAEWSMNKKVVDLKGKDIRKGVPKGLPYFWVDFGMEPGYAHVIEDQHLFPKTFAEEVIAGILDLDHTCWKNPKREYGDVQKKKAFDFIKDWKPFEPHKNI